VALLKRRGEELEKAPTRVEIGETQRWSNESRRSFAVGAAYRHHKGWRIPRHSRVTVCPYDATQDGGVNQSPRMASTRRLAFVSRSTISSGAISRDRAVDVLRLQTWIERRP